MRRKKIKGKKGENQEKQGEKRKTTVKKGHKRKQRKKERKKETIQNEKPLNMSQICKPQGRSSRGWSSAENTNNTRKLKETQGKTRKHKEKRKNNVKR